MPLRDHFRPTLKQRRWASFHATWPTFIITSLNEKLPERYAAEPRIHLGQAFEVDVGAMEDRQLGTRPVEDFDTGGVATTVWVPAAPTLTLAMTISDQDEFEVRIYDDDDRRLVAAIELVSPANKDRPESRRAFVAKCAALLQKQVCVTIVDVVTSRSANLYDDLMDWFELADPSLAGGAPMLSAVTCRWIKRDRGGVLESWFHPLSIGEVLPTLPLWLDEHKAIPLELEASYEATRQVLRIA